MAFAFTKDLDFVAGDLRFTGGSYTSTSNDTGGDIYTGLQKVDGALIQQKAISSAVIASQAAINETFPKADPITIVTIANGVGWWLAFGH
jgi:hypothetical protein